MCHVLQTLLTFFQVGTSACGATAVINVLLALEMPHTLGGVLSAVPTRLRDNRAQLPRYLASRAVAGTTHKDLIGALEEISKGEVFCR